MDERQKLREFIMENITVDETIYSKAGKMLAKRIKPLAKKASKMRWSSKLGKLIPQSSVALA